MCAFVRAYARGPDDRLQTNCACKLLRVKVHEFRILHMRIAFAVSLGRSIAIARENFEIGGQQIFIGRNAFLDASVRNASL